MKKHQVKDGWIIWEPNFIEENEANKLLDHFLSNLNWESGEIKLFGKTYQIPRKQIYFADQGMDYHYSGKKLSTNKWDSEVNQLKIKLEKVLGIDFNACLANLYRNGEDSNGWHADNEKELGENPTIASISFGTTRKFQLKHQDKEEKLSYSLPHGSLLVMGGAMQHYWKHTIPKQKNIDKARVNLTFRKIKV